MTNSTARPFVFLPWPRSFGVDPKKISYHSQAAEDWKIKMQHASDASDASDAQDAQN